MTHLTKLGTSLPDCSPESELLPELVVPASDSPPPRRRRLKSRSLLNNTSRTDTGSLSRGFSWALARGTWNLKGPVFILDFNAFSGTGTHKSTAPGAVRPEGALPYSSQDLTKKQQSWSSRVPPIIKGHFKLPGMVPQEKKFIGAATEFCSKAYTCALLETLRSASTLVLPYRRSLTQEPASSESRLLIVAHHADPELA